MDTFLNKFKINHLHYEALFCIFFFYLSYIYFYDFDQGISLAPIYIKGIKDLVFIFIFILYRKTILKSSRNNTLIIFSVCILLSCVINKNFNSLIQFRNVIYSIICSHILLSRLTKPLVTLRSIALISVAVGYLLLPISPWENREMVGALGNPANFYFLSISLYISLTDYNKSFYKKMYLLFLTIFATFLTGALGGTLILLGIITINSLFNIYFKRYADFLLEYFMFIASGLLTYLYSPSLINLNLIKTLISKIPFLDIKFETEDTISVTNRLSQLENLKEISILPPKTTNTIISDFQLIELQQNLGIFPVLVITILISASIHQCIIKRDKTGLLLITLIILTSILNPIFRYVPSSIIIFYILFYYQNKNYKISLPSST